MGVLFWKMARKAPLGGGVEVHGAGRQEVYCSTMKRTFHVQGLPLVLIRSTRVSVCQQKNLSVITCFYAGDDSLLYKIVQSFLYGILCFFITLERKPPLDYPIHGVSGRRMCAQVLDYLLTRIWWCRI